MKIETILDRKTEGVVTIDHAATLKAAADLMMRRRIAALIATEKGQPVGLLSERDLVSAIADLGPRAADTPIHEALSGPMLTVSPDESIRRAMALMTCKRMRHLPVFQERELIGIVSLGDLIKYRLEEMELERNVLRDLAIAVR
jgi:CBS domain-containing protein